MTDQSSSSPTRPSTAASRSTITAGDLTYTSWSGSHGADTSLDTECAASRPATSHDDKAIVIRDVLTDEMTVTVGDISEAASIVVGGEIQLRQKQEKRMPNEEEVLDEDKQEKTKKDAVAEEQEQDRVPGAEHTLLVREIRVTETLGEKARRSLQQRMTLFRRFCSERRELPPVPQDDLPTGTRSDYVTSIKQRMVAASSQAADVGISAWEVLDCGAKSVPFVDMLRPRAGEFDNNSTWEGMTVEEPIGALCELYSRFGPTMVVLKCLMADNSIAVYYTPWWPTGSDWSDFTRKDLDKIHAFVFHDLRRLWTRCRTLDPALVVTQLVPAPGRVLDLVKHIFGETSDDHDLSPPGPEYERCAKVDHFRYTHLPLSVLLTTLPRRYMTPGRRPWIGQALIESKAGADRPPLSLTDVKISMFSAVQLATHVLPQYCWQTDDARGVYEYLPDSFIETHLRE